MLSWVACPVSTSWLNLSTLITCSQTDILRVLQEAESL